MTRYSHAPVDYVCPFCQVTDGIERPSPGTAQRDVVLRRPDVTAFIASKWWPNNKGHVLVVPNRHFENIYELPVDVAGSIHQAAQLVALAMKATYGCGGISTRQHNEPDGNQDVWHYHLHVFPRYRDDHLYQMDGRFTEPEERIPYADKLTAWIHAHT